MLYYLLFGSDMTAEQAVINFVITIIVFVISLSIHEFAHALSAFKQGDPTAKLAGRLTLNPFKHLSPSGFLMFVFFGVGWAKPTPVNPLNFKKYRSGIRKVSSAGVIANFILGLISAVLYAILYWTIGVPNEFMMYLLLILQYFMLINSFLALFNILPIYPLDGFNFITSFMKTENKYIRFNLKNGNNILIGILLTSLIIEIIFGFDLIDLYLSLLYNYVYMPITFIGALF